jgi:hypothetical protein
MVGRVSAHDEEAEAALRSYVDDSDSAAVTPYCANTWPTVYAALR